MQGLVFLPGKRRHLLDGLKLLARDHIKVAQNALGLRAEQRVELAPHPLGHACGVVHQTRNLVEKPAGGLGHRSASRLTCLLLRQWQSNFALASATIEDLTAAKGGATQGFGMPLMAFSSCTKVTARADAAIAAVFI